MKAYFARPVTHYGQDFDKAIVNALRQAHMEVVDPSDSRFQEEYKLRGMEVFTDAVASCDVFFYRSFEDGSLGAGVLKEFSTAVVMGIPTVQIQAGSRSWNYLSVEETRDRVKYGRI